ncbi:ABC transporter permease/substrate-binding protein [Enterococcus faecium]|uniref:ABC transporter permease/substrate-binding protein n=1 Tax=Enterococcus faecium TaxID=1352 RepID=UPI001262827B|nr:ABC transporter permease/substrate-binding protein [Enterococcus faecium]KAB7599567.1 ABC transporter permease/substrate-binding protein [Enterococcus faecium]KAB7605736.1 ABC transporter permease/substrate-binding protein [Enterococcus faecium]KAB7608364.1 ABC transporter permease/substrate-binding protein [Enterococcus faecium]HAP6287204.1 ABC transporter permease/substrate-binding protein [Enterococcus faecium]HAP6290153.1 ABC transporter permease/substrate-binding protein [Enterococcus 
MNNFIQTLSERKGELLEAAFQHLSISLISLLIAALIAIPLAIWAANHKKMAEVLLQITGVLQTIPSLALLGLLIPFVGIGTVPALIALVIYALLPIFQNTYIGLAEIDPSIEEAAVAFGMSRMRRLLKVELPIALPVIISGIRTALVLIIGTATLAALIGAGGLGTFILLGIDRNTPVLTLIGAISSALLAIIFSGLIRWLQHKKPRYSIITLAAVVCLFGGVSLYQSALFKNETIIYPEFTGTVLESLVKVPEAMKSADLTKEKTYDEAEELLNKQFDMTLLKPMAYQNTYALAVKRSFANEHQLKKISDLAAISDQIKAGFTLEFIDRSDGYKGIQEAYGLNFSSVQSMEPSLRYQAINNGDVNIVDAYSTDSQLKEYDLVTLEDDRGLFPAYQGAPLMKKDFAKEHPEIVKALNKLSGKITEDQMIDMNYQVNVEKKKPTEVARIFLKNEGLVKEEDQ